MSLVLQQILRLLKDVLDRMQWVELSHLSLENLDLHTEPPL